MQEDKMTRSPGEPEPSLASDGCTPVLPAEWTAVMDESTDYSECTDYSDEDYEPNIDSESSDLSSCSRSAMLSNISPKKLKRNNDKDSVLTRIQQKGAVKAVNSQCQVSSSEIHASSSRESCPTEPDTSTPSDQGCVHVVPMPTSSKSWRYTKKQYCLYCEKPYSKISRHLQYVHHNEPDVAKAFSFDKKSKERRVRLRLLTTRGNFLHNALISSSGKGDLVARRRPQKLGSTQEFTHCIHCQGLYARKSLWRHIRNCPQNPKVDEPGNRKKMVQSLNCMARVPPDVSKAFWKTVMCQMKHDEVSAVIRNDKYILLFGEQMFNKLNPSSTKNDYIRQKMREVGRLLLEARRLTPIRSMEDFVLPSNFPHVIKSVRAVSGHCEETNTYRIPSLALKLGHSLSKIATSVECSAIITGRERLAEDARSFRVLQEHKWNESISAAAGTTLNEAKMNKPQVLPFTEDVKTLHSFLNTEMTKYQHALKDHSDVKTYASLCKLVLAKVILFNRRRGGEASRMKLESYVSRVKSPVHEDLASGLSDFEKKLCEHFQRVEIRGKRGRKVAVLLTPDMVNCMDLLVQHRDICQVPEENVHLFARPNALSSYRGSDVLREFGESCGARNPSALSSTKLRKQIATLSTVLNLKDNEMDQLASFLGHDIRIHRQYYRLPESTLQLAKMSKLLIAMERGTLSEFQGATLDEIVINPQDEIEDSNADTSSDEAESDDPQPSCSSRTPEPSPSESAQFSNPHDRGNKGMKRKHDLSLDQSHQHSTQTTGITQSKKKWSDNEVQAVEKHLMRFINSCQVPGKKDCVSCLLSEPDALKHRDWTALKYYVKNRIVALKRRQSL
ncbi:uncharacterized protein LOC143500340 isoform X1 [Brachyhypopomus gauderio]|uniref:uncharacterized protein LOC143500340 isoform X1 n=1 Tax=Brachyhypopomus gauderio TaxID=698409 RepID=UPI004041F102